MGELTGDYTEAVRAHRRSFELLTALGDTSYASTAAGLLARALHALGQDDEAAAMARISREAASPDDLDTQVQWRLAEAGVLSANGDVATAERLAHEALNLSAQTDLELRGDILATLAEIAVTAGRTDDAEGYFTQSVQAHARKGNVTAANAVRGRLTALARSAS
jgi:tetratricopeptide (TPR) repeat protein